MAIKFKKYFLRRNVCFFFMSGYKKKYFRSKIVAFIMELSIANYLTKPLIPANLEKESDNIITSYLI